VEKKKRPDIEVTQTTEVASVESEHKENATLHSTVKKKDRAMAISQQKKSATGITNNNTHAMQIKDVKLEVEEKVVEQRVKLQVHEQNDVEVGNEDGVKLLYTNQFNQKLKLIGKGGQIVLYFNTPHVQLSRVQTWDRSRLQFIFIFLINHAQQDSNLRHLFLIPC
jgi:hypothetical protein